MLVTEPQVAHDRFEQYFAEKLWDLIPTVYKMEDGASDAPSPGALRALAEIIAEQAAILRRSHDRLWEDQFVELADDWAVPYIADLVATRLVSALNPAGRRVDVAKTIYYRRRKGTLAVLEELIADIARWEGKTVEMFRRLARARHRLDEEPALDAGLHTGTLPGGWADLRSLTARGTTGGPFDEFHHTPDFRRHEGRNGRYGISKLGFFLYRLGAYRVSGVTPRLMHGTTGFTFDPSGRNVPLFMPRNRPADWSQWRSALEWELPSRLPMRVLNDAQFTVTEGVVRHLADQAGISSGAESDLRSVRDVRFRDESRFRDTLSTMASSSELLSAAIYEALATLALVDDCGKAVVLPDDQGQPTLVADALSVNESNRGLVTRQSIIGAGLGSWSTSATDRRLAIDPACGRMLFLDGPDASVTADYYYGFSGEIGAGTYDRRLCLSEQIDFHVSGGGDHLDFEDLDNGGVTQIDDSATYEPVSDKLAVRDLTVQAANGQRPYLLPGANWVLNAAEHEDATATLDGLWIGGVGGSVIFRAERNGQRGNYRRVTIRHCTLDPGGEAADGSAIAAVPILVDCRIQELVIQSSIVGPIMATAEGAVEKLTICDSIVHSTDSTVPAIELNSGIAMLRRVTVLGEMKLHRLRASEVLAVDLVTVIDTQDGCFRFSAAPPASRAPSPYRSFTLTDDRSLFASRRFGDPGYLQLSAAAPAEIATGAEDGSEMGAFSAQCNPIKLQGLTAKAEEYMPFGLIPLFVTES